MSKINKTSKILTCSQCREKLETCDYLHPLWLNELKKIYIDPENKYTVYYAVVGAINR